MLLVRLAVGLGLLVFLLTRLDFSTVSIAGPGARVAGVAAAAGLILVAQLISAVRWGLIIGPDAPGFAYLGRLYLIGNFFSLFLPSSVGGDAVRAVAASRATGRPAATVTSVVADRAAGVIALVFYLGIGAVASPTLMELVRGEIAVTTGWIAGAAVALVLAAGVVLVALFAPRVRPRLERAAAVLLDLARSPARLVGVSALAMVVQGLYILAWWALGTLLGLTLGPETYLFTVPVVSLAAMLPVTLSGLGVREGAWLILLAPLGVSGPDAVAFSLLFFAALAVAGAVGGVLFALRGTEPRPRGAPSGGVRLRERQAPAR